MFPGRTLPPSNPITDQNRAAVIAIEPHRRYQIKPSATAAVTVTDPSRRRRSIRSDPRHTLWLRRLADLSPASRQISAADLVPPPSPRSAADCRCVIAGVNFAGAVSFKGRKTEVALTVEEADEVKVEYEEYRTDVSALFIASHSGNLPLLKKLMGDLMSNMDVIKTKLHVRTAQFTAFRQ